MRTITIALALAAAFCGCYNVHKATVQQLNEEAVQLYNQGKVPEGIEAQKRAVEIARAQLPENDPYYIATLNNLIEFYRILGRYAEAEKAVKEALDVSARAFGEESNERAEALTRQGLLYIAMGRYADAEAPLKQAAEIRRKTVGEKDAAYGLAIHNVAGLYRMMGRYAEAEPLFQKAIDALGENHEHYGVALDNMGELYRDMGRYAEAEPLYKKALEAKRKAHGEETTAYAISLNNLALLYQLMGRYPEAEPMFRRTVDILRTTLGEKTPECAMAVMNYANFLSTLTRYPEALPQFERAAETLRALQGEEHPGYALCLVNMGTVLCGLKRYDEAAAVQEKALAIFRKSLGEDHPNCANAMDCLAYTYTEMGRLDDAERLQKRSIEMKRKTFGDGHASTGSSVSNLANIYRVMGRYAEAEALLKDVTAKYHGSATSMVHLTYVYAATDRCPQAHQTICQAFNAGFSTVSRLFTISSEKQKSEMLSTLWPTMRIVHTLAAVQLRNDAGASRTAFQVLLLTKAITQEAMMSEQRALLESPDPKVREAFNSLKRTCERLASLTLRGPGKMPMEAYRQEIAKLEKEQQDLEADLARRSEEFGLLKQLMNVSIETVQSGLPADSVLVTYCRTEIVNFKSKRTEPESLGARYLAYVLGKTGGVQAPIDLGDADTIDKAVRAFRSAAQDPGKDAAAPAQRLYDLVFRPIEPHIPPRSRLLISPDGQLCIVPFEALSDGKGWLLDRFGVSYLDAGRDVLRFAKRGKATSGEAVLLYDPDYDLSAEERLRAVTEVRKTKAQARVPADRRSSVLQGTRFERLPGTCDEGLALSKLLESNGLSVRRCSGSLAIEDVLKETESPRVLHLATHGFFLEDQFADALAGAPGRRGVLLSAGGVGFQPGAILAENPLLRSGLVFAGANRLGDAGPDSEDGLATSLELSKLDLRGTELVVLSACDTGVGEIRVGEGVFGLRRAIQHAGARSIVMSLWKVDDRATRLLIERFYRNWLGGAPKSQALTEAKRWLMSHEEEATDAAASLLQGREVRTRKRPYAHPFFWAPFVLVGDWE